LSTEVPDFEDERQCRAAEAMIELGEKMALLDWSQCPAVESVPDRRSGAWVFAWVFKDTRMPVSTVFENLESAAGPCPQCFAFQVPQDCPPKRLRASGNAETK